MFQFEPRPSVTRRASSGPARALDKVAASLAAIVLPSAEQTRTNRPLFTMGNLIVTQQNGTLLIGGSWCLRVSFKHGNCLIRRKNFLIHTAKGFLAHEITGISRNFSVSRNPARVVKFRKSSFSNSFFGTDHYANICYPFFRSIGWNFQKVFVTDGQSQ